MRTVLQEGIDALTTALVEFGYPSVTAEIVEAAYQNWKAGNEPQGVIEMFAFKDFDQYPNIFGEPAA